VSTREMNNGEATPLATNETSTMPRRAALARAGLLAGGMLLSGTLSGRSARAQDASDTTMSDSTTTGATMLAPGASPTNPFGELVNLASDVDIFNFALILEHLESEFYTRALEAHAARPYLKGRVPFIAQKLASDENAHVVAVTQRIQSLGGTPVAKPEFQFPAEAFISEVAFLDFSGVLEQNGVHAYLGAAPKVRRRDNLRFAASIYGIEARHTALIRFYVGRVFAPSEKETPLPAEEIARRSMPFILPVA
jgi:rubrerythrin